MERNYLLFDLDGTLTDPGIGITKSVQYALRSYGIEEPDLTKLYPFIGPPLRDSFIRYYNFSEEQAMEAIGRYREYYTVRGIYENAVYDGIPEMLSRLKDAGAYLAVATSKPEDFAVQIISHFGLESYFDHVCGAAMNETDRATKADVIRYALETIGVDDRRQVLMTGDREHDVLGARANGLDCVGVLFGYGNRKELEEVQAYRIVRTVGELTACLLEELGR